jgi:hypothetical protein
VTSDQADQLLQTLADGFPLVNLSETSRAQYRRRLTDLDHAAAIEAVDALILDSAEFPTIAAIRRQVIEAEATIPTAIEAYGRIFDRDAEPADMHPFVKHVVKVFGGSYSIKSHENPSIIRAQFLKTYDELREKELRRANVDHWRNAA